MYCSSIKNRHNIISNEQHKAPKAATFQSRYLVRCDVFFLLTLGHVSPHLPAVFLLPEAIRATPSTHDALGHWRKISQLIRNGSHRGLKPVETCIGQKQVIIPAEGEGNTKMSTLRKKLLDIWEIYKSES